MNTRNTIARFGGWRRLVGGWCVVLCMTLFACGKESHIHVDDTQLVGKWVKSGTQEYWRYDADHTGNTWDVGEDISEEESNLVFSWSLDEDLLTHVFAGAMGNQAVPKIYTIKEIDASMMKWEDDYGMRYTLVRVEN